MWWPVRELVATSCPVYSSKPGRNQIRSDKDKKKTSEQPVQESVHSVRPIEKISIHVHISQKEKECRHVVTGTAGLLGVPRFSRCQAPHGSSDLLRLHGLPGAAEPTRK